MAETQAKCYNKHAAIITDVTGDRLTKYSILNELEFALKKGFAQNISEVWKIDDAYVTLSMCSDMEANDIQSRIDDRISKIK